jgi:hypothetical protein
VRPNAREDRQINLLDCRPELWTWLHPAATSVCLAGKPENRKYSRQFGIHPGNLG